MSWRDNLIQASFRGANFYVQSHDYAIGRRNVVHQYPFKDDPYAEDLGLDADEFTIDGYVIANESNDQDYFSERNALISALKKNGSGKLNHPYLGVKDVVLIGKARIREIFTEGGIARFSMTFKIAGQNKYPKDDVNPIGLVDKAAEEASDVAMDSFYDQYSLEDEPSFSVSGMIDDFGKFVAISKTKINAIRSGTGSSLEYAKSVFDDARNTLLDVVQYPCQVANLALDCVDSILELANVIGTGYLGQILGNCSERIIKSRLSSTGDEINNTLGMEMTRAMLGVSGSSSSTGFGAISSSSIEGIGDVIEISVTTAARARQASNRLAFVNMAKTMNVIGATRSAIRTKYDSFEQSTAIQEEIVDSIDYLLLKLGDESASDPYSDYGIYVDNRNIYSQLEQLRATFVKAMRKNSLDLSNEITFEPGPEGLTSLQVAYSKYNDIDREEEVFLRNQPTVVHPGFIIESIKILSN